MEPIKLALVGCGGIMKAHFEAMKEMRAKGLVPFDVVAACDVVEDNARELAGMFEELQGHAPKVFTDLYVMLDKMPDIEAVDICTLHSEHHTVAIPCFEAGKHVVLEKPIGISMRAGKLILDAAARSQKAFMVAENYRFSPGERMRRWAIQSGRIGQPRMFFWVEVGEGLGKWGWRNFKHQAGGGWVLDGGVHFADLFRFHLGCEAKDAFAVTKHYEPFRYDDPENRTGAMNVTVEDATLALINFDNDILVQWVSVHSAPGEGIGRRTLYGSEGSIDWGKGLTLRSGTNIDNEALLKEFMASLSEEEKEKLFPSGITNEFAIELKDFADSVRLGTVPEITGLEGYKDLGLCMALFESAWHNRPVTIKEIESCELEGYQLDLNEEL